MSEEELFNIVKASKEPVRSVQELSKKLVGTSKGMFFYTKNFRLDFEYMCSKLNVYEEKIEELENNIKEIIDYVYKHGFYCDDEDGVVPNELGMYEIAHVMGELNKLVKNIDELCMEDSKNKEHKVISYNHMVNVDNHNFHCECGANVFTLYDDNVFVWHGCGNEYKGDPINED